jgi:hypothetical protein
MQCVFNVIEIQWYLTFIFEKYFAKKNLYNITLYFCSWSHINNKKGEITPYIFLEKREEVKENLGIFPHEPSPPITK